MTWMSISCPGCRVAALHSGSSFDRMVAEGRIHDGVVVRHLEGCAEPVREITALRQELARTSRLLTAAIVAFVVSAAGWSYTAGLSQNHAREAEHWSRVADPARVAEELIASQNQHTAQLIDAQNESTSAFLEEMQHVMKVHDTTMARLTDVMEVVEAARSLVLAKRPATAGKLATQPARADIPG